MKYPSILRVSLILISTFILSACGSDNQKSLSLFSGIAAVQSSGDGESQVEFTDASENIESGFLPKPATDYAVFANGEFLYHLGKYGVDAIQKYHIDNPELGYYPNGGYILRESGSDTSANPHQIAFLNDEANTAVITRYGHLEAWVVNLDAQTFDNFIIEKLDLSHHADSVTDADTDPEADMVFIAGGKAFITMQNLSGYTPDNTAKVAVFNTSTWQEIATDSSIEGVQAISLSLQNHQSGVIYNNKIYLGSLVYSGPTGGLEIINTDTYSTNVITDDLAVSNIAVNEFGKVFFTGYAAWESNSLYVLNSNNSYNLVSSDLENINITSLSSPGDSIWIGTNSLDINNDEEIDNAILRIDSEYDYSTPAALNDILLSSIETALKPIGVAFFDIENDLPEVIE
jgi:hypothetical protein